MSVGQNFEHYVDDMTELFNKGNEDGNSMIQSGDAAVLMSCVLTLLCRVACQGA